MRRRLVPLLLLATCPPLQGLGAQVDGSVALGVGTVRGAGDSGGAAFSTASVAPSGSYSSPTFTSSLGASLASLPGAVWSAQGRSDTWGASRPLGGGPLRLGGELILAGTARTDGGSSGAAQGVGEVLWSAPSWGFGVGLGPACGWIASELPVYALHGRGRVWMRAATTDWSLAVEPTRFPDGWFTDVSVGANTERRAGTASLWIGGRLSGVYGSTGAASASLQVYVSRWVSIELAGGSFLKEPYQGLPRTGFFTAGVRLHARPHVPRVSIPALPVMPERRGDSVVVRFRLGGARTVAIAGDWNGWTPQALRPLGRDRWEGALALPAGLYHFNLVVDSTDWVVPRGGAVITDELGGLVALLLVR